MSRKQRRRKRKSIGAPRGLSTVPVETVKSRRVRELEVEMSGLTKATQKKVFIALGIAAIGAIGYMIFPKGDSSEGMSEQSAESLEKSEITLGNVKFVLDGSSDLSVEEKKDLFAKLESAYKKLSAHFGEELMTMKEPIVFPVIVKKGFEQGLVGWNVQAKIADDGHPRVTNKPVPKDLILSNVSEDVIGHEFVHLYLQTPGFWSESFHEGHAYAIQHLLFNVPRLSDDIANVTENRHVDKMLDIPLDFNKMDESVYKGGVQNGLLKRLVLVKWQIEWKKFAENNPDFFKKFYSEVSKKKAEGVVSLTKAELLEIAEKVNPNFRAWYEGDGVSSKEIGEVVHKPMLEAVVVRDVLPGKALVVVASFQSNARKVENNVMTPPYFSNVGSGNLYASFPGENGAMQNVPLKRVNANFTLMPLPLGVVSDPNFRIMMGGEEVPLRR